MKNKVVHGDKVKCRNEKDLDTMFFVLNPCRVIEMQDGTYTQIVVQNLANYSDFRYINEEIFDIHWYKVS